MAEEKHLPPESNSAVGPADPEVEGAMGGPNGEPAVEIGVSDIGVDELDQSSIDALFAGDDDSAADQEDKEEAGAEEASRPDAEPEETEKPEKADDDQQDGEQQAGEDGSEAAETEDIDQGLPTADSKEMEAEHDQDDIDQIFASLNDDNEPFIPDMEFAEEVGEEEISELPDLDLQKEDPRDLADFDQEDDLASEPVAAPVESACRKPSPVLLLTAAACLLLLVIFFIGLVYLVKKNDVPPTPPPLPAAPEVAVNATIANFIPQVKDINLTMPAGGGEVQVVFNALDKDNDVIIFKVSEPPAHGRLSGKMPALTYLPNNNFPGKDVFTYMAFDGRDHSVAARVIIRGPDLTRKPAPPVASLQPRFIAPKVPRVAAMDMVIDGKSTTPVIIDPVVIWQMANQLAVPSRLTLKVEDLALRGQLKAGADGRYIYGPDPYFRGQEVINYRLKSGGISSPSARIVLNFVSGHPGPRLKVSTLAPSLLVGETVLLDARQTRGEAGAELHFSWQQLTGPDVVFKQLSEDGSLVSFVVPSAYLRTGQDRLVFRVEVVDVFGKKDSRELSTRIISRRTSPLWRLAP